MMMAFDNVRQGFMKLGLIKQHQRKDGRLYYTMDPVLRSRIDAIPFPMFNRLDKLADPNTSFWGNAIKSLTGIKIAALDERAKLWAIEEALNKAFENAQREGNIQKFTTFYKRDITPNQSVNRLLEIQKELRQRRKEYWQTRRGAL